MRQSRKNLNEKGTKKNENNKFYYNFYVKHESERQGRKESESKKKKNKGKRYVYLNREQINMMDNRFMATKRDLDNLT